MQGEMGWWAWIIGKFPVPVLERHKELQGRGDWVKGENRRAACGGQPAEGSHGLGTAGRGDPWWTCGFVRPPSLNFTNRIDSWVGIRLHPIHKIGGFSYYYHCYPFSELRKSLSREIE